MGKSHTLCHVRCLKFLIIFFIKRGNRKTGFCGGSVVKNLSANAGDVGSIPGLGRSAGAGNGKSLQYSFLGNPMGREAWWATAHGVAKESDKT